MPKFDVICLGSYCTDLIFTGMDSLPELGREVLSTGFEMLVGETYNSVLAMHRLGIRVGWAADFGNDILSKLALEQIARDEVDTSLFVVQERPFRRITVAASFPEDRAFLTYYDPDPPVPAALKMLPRASAAFMYFPGYFFGGLFEAGARLVKLKKMKIVMDGNCGALDLEPDAPILRKTLQKVDIFMPNACEALRMTGEANLDMAMRKLGSYCPLVVVKDGANGSFGVQKGQVIHVPALPITPVDTTGAGDVFNAGFLRGWLDGLSLQTCLQMGNIAGGLSTTARGGTTRAVTPQDIQQAIAFYQQAP